MFPYFRASIVLVTSLLLSAGIAGANSLPTDDSPGHWQQDLLQHRHDEAAAKETLVRGHLKALAEKTPNQDLYDVHHYRLELDLNPTSRLLDGVVSTSVLVTGSSLESLELNLSSGMSVSAVTAGGVATSFSRNGNILTVNLDRSYAQGESVTVTVSYGGNPAGGSFGWSSHSGQHMIWTLSEPFGARDWWPCKDLNTDKADSLDVVVTVPSNLVAASNGLLLSDTVDGSQRTFHWQSHYPIATYLVSLAIYPYSQFSHWYTPQDGAPDMEVQYFVYPDHYNQVQETYALTVPMIDTFAQAFGEYPFVNEKYGHAEFTWGGGMEHQTLTSMGGWAEDLISHELAHQWWGDMVTCADFGHIWLNEGFASWCEAYWAEQTYGWDSYQQYMSAAAYYGSGTIFVENPLSDNIFDGNLSYDKGSWVVHMLRGVLGDEDFFTGLRLFRENHLYGSATTEELQAVLENISGIDLTAFFQQWIYGEYFPVYQMNWEAGPGQVTVNIDQVQNNTGIFTMPVPLRITTDLGTTVVKVQNDQQSQSFVIPVDGTVQGVDLDPDHWILRQVQTTVSQASLDQGVLLVNGVSWDTYGAEITGAYESRAFWGDTPITFWDNFSEPAGGYPATLPQPLGHGHVPADVIGNFSTVIWVGNNYLGDLAKWAETPILSYLQAGGNVLLMTRRSQDFLSGGLGQYLDVSFAESSSTLGNCAAAAPGLVSMSFTGQQTWNDVYNDSVGPDSITLFRDTSGFGGNRLTGVVTIPPSGGTFRPDGGRFALISARPYRLQSSALSANVEHILAEYMLEPYTPVVSPVEDQPEDFLPGAIFLGANFPNPFNPRTSIPFTLGQAGSITLDIYDARGRLLRDLAAKEYPAGSHQVTWDGTDQLGRALPSGLYFARLKDASGNVQTRGMVLVR